MSSSKATKVVLEPVLSTSDDWGLWIEYIRRLAVNEGVWDYIDPYRDPAELLVNTKPIQPQEADHVSRASTQTSIQSERDCRAQYYRWRDVMDDFERQYKRWDEVRSGLAEIDNYILSHIDSGLYYIIKRKSVRDSLLALKAPLSPRRVDFD